MKISKQIKAILTGNLTNIEKLIMIDQIVDIDIGQEWNPSKIAEAIGLPTNQVRELSLSAGEKKPEKSKVITDQQRYFGVWQSEYKKLSDGVAFDFIGSEGKALVNLSKKMSTDDLKLVFVFAKKYWKTPTKIKPSIVYNNLNDYKMKIKSFAGDGANKKYNW